MRLYNKTGEEGLTLFRQSIEKLNTISDSDKSKSLAIIRNSPIRSLFGC